LKVTPYLSQRIAEGIKNVASNFFISCLKLSKVDGFHYMVSDLVRGLLEKRNGLKELHLDGNQIGDKEVIEIAEVLVLNESLGKLNLSQNNIGDEGADVLKKALVKRNERVYSTRLKKLDLSHNKICQLRGWVKALSSQLTPLELDLSDNKIGDHEMEKYGRKLIWDFVVKLNSKKWDQIIAQVEHEKQLIRDNESLVENKKAKKISNALPENIDVEALDLDTHQILDAGAIATTHELPENIDVETLDLNTHQVLDAEAIATTHELPENIDVETLDLNTHQVLDAEAIAIDYPLKENEKLETLNLQSNSIEEQGDQSIQKIFEENENFQNWSPYVDEDQDEIGLDIGWRRVVSDAEFFNELFGDG